MPTFQFLDGTHYEFEKFNPQHDTGSISVSFLTSLRGILTNAIEILHTEQQRIFALARRFGGVLDTVNYPMGKSLTPEDRVTVQKEIDDYLAIDAAPGERNRRVVAMGRIARLATNLQTVYPVGTYLPIELSLPGDRLPAFRAFDRGRSYVRFIVDIDNLTGKIIM